MNNKRKKKKLFMLISLYISCTFGIQWRCMQRGRCEVLPKKEERRKNGQGLVVFFSVVVA